MLEGNPSIILLDIRPIWHIYNVKCGNWLNLNNPDEFLMFPIPEFWQNTFIRFISFVNINIFWSFPASREGCIVKYVKGIRLLKEKVRSFGRLRSMSTFIKGPRYYKISQLLKWSTAKVKRLMAMTRKILFAYLYVYFKDFFSHSSKFWQK